MATHSSPLAWKIPWTEEPGRLQSMGLLRVGHDWATSLSHTGDRNGSPLQCSCLENPRDRGAWWAAVYGVTQSRTRLKWLSTSSSKVVSLGEKLVKCCVHHKYPGLQQLLQVQIGPYNRVSSIQTWWGFPGSSVVKSLRVKAGHMGSPPDPGISHRLRGN